MKDQSTQTNDIKLILPEKAYSTNESFNSTLMSIGSDDSRDQDWEPEIDSEDLWILKILKVAKMHRRQNTLCSSHV